MLQNGDPYIDGLVKERLTPLLTNWSYVFLALTHTRVMWVTTASDITLVPDQHQAITWTNAALPSVIINPRIYFNEALF